MGLNVIGAQGEGSKVKVIVEGDSFAEVSSSEAKNIALAEAQKILGLCGISGSSGPYPVDLGGEEIQDAAKFAEAVKNNGGNSVFKYRNDYSVQQSLAL